jgi:predicted dehydrogenase
MSNAINRGEFIRRVSLAGSSLVMSPYLTSGAGIFKGAPNIKVVMGIMGTNSRGLFLAKAFAKLPNVDVAYICDPDATVLAKTIKEVESVSGKKPTGFADIRKMLEKKDLDGLAIAAPDHWHTPAAIMALQAGKHVYVEKPCSHNPREGEMLVDATNKYKRLVQMGSQRRSFSNVKGMVDKLRNGVSGRVYFA